MCQYIGLMKLLSVIPISRGINKETLSYFTGSDITVGSVVKVPLRKKIIPAIVISAEEVSDVKAEIKNADFETRKVEKLKSSSHKIKTFISPSGIGIYGNGEKEWCEENHAHGKDFLARVCEQWEAAAMKMESLGIRVVIFRQGIVLGNDGGALPVMARPVKLFAGAPLGSGLQYLSWIHIDDLCRLYVHAIKTETMRGVYNAVAPNPVTNKDFTKTLGTLLHRPVWPFAVPSYILKIFLGEQASIVLDGQRVVNKKIISEWFIFNYSELEGTLRALY